MNKNMELTECFLDCLEKWGKGADPKGLSLKDEIYNLLFRLGVYLEKNVDDATTDTLRKRITYLVDTQKFHERFLIDSLINQISNDLKDSLINQGSAIIRNESAIERAKEDGMNPDFFVSNLDRLKDPLYAIRAQNDLERWESIIATDLPVSKRDNLNI